MSFPELKLFIQLSPVTETKVSLILSHLDVDYTMLVYIVKVSRVGIQLIYILALNTIPLYNCLITAMRRCSLNTVI